MGFFGVLFYLIIFPAKMKIDLNSDGTMHILVRTSFYYKREYTIIPKQLKLVARRKYANLNGMIFGGVIYGKNEYQPIICYTEDGERKFISLMMSGSSLRAGIGPYGVMTKEEILAFAKELGTKAEFHDD
jgi:hypothetical protein